MSFDGNGIYNLPTTSVTPAVSTTTIDSSDFNTFTADLKTALTLCLTKDGQSTASAAIDFDQGIELAGTAVTKTAAEINDLLEKSGGTMTGDLTVTHAASPRVIAYSTDASSIGVRLISVDGSSARIDTLDNAGVFDAAALSFGVGGNVDVPTGTFSVGGTGSVTAIHDEDTMVSDDANGLASQQSIKKYVDDNTGAISHGARVNSAGTLTTGSTGIGSSKTTTGEYSVSHSIGDTNYSAIVTTTSDNTIAKINAVGAAGVGVHINRVDTGAAIDDGFNIVIVEW